MSFDCSRPMSSKSRDERDHGEKNSTKRDERERWYRQNLFFRFFPRWKSRGRTFARICPCAFLLEGSRVSSPRIRTETLKQKKAHPSTYLSSFKHIISLCLCLCATNDARRAQRPKKAPPFVQRASSRAAVVFALRCRERVASGARR